MNESIKKFLDELSSYSPTTDKFEGNMVTLLIYVSLLKKNTNVILNKIPTKEHDKIKDFKKSILQLQNTISKNYNISKEYVNNYLLALKMEKESQEELKKYHEFIDKITSDKLLIYLEIVKNISLLIENFEAIKNLYDDESIKVCFLSINIIDIIKQFILDVYKNEANDLSDDALLEKFLDNIKEYEN